MVPPQGRSGLGNEGLMPVLALTLSDPGSAVFDFQISKGKEPLSLTPLQG